MAKKTTELDSIYNELDVLKDRVDTIQTEMQESFDNKSEKWQEGDVGQEFQSKLDNLQEAVDAIDTAMGAIQNAS